MHGAVLFTESSRKKFLVFGGLNENDCYIKRGCVIDLLDNSVSEIPFMPVGRACVNEVKTYDQHVYVFFYNENQQEGTRDLMTFDLSSYSWNFI